MRLEVSNVAKIKKMDIALDGITVIAGENNTGKSTVGKILFSAFNSLYDIAGKVEQSRENEVISRARRITNNVLMEKKDNERWGTDIRASRNVERVFRELIRQLDGSEVLLMEESDLRRIFLAIAEKNDVDYDEYTVNEFVEKMLQTIDLVNRTESHTIALEIISRFFNSVFRNQIGNLANNDPAKIKLTIQGQEIEFEFSANECKLSKNSIDIMHEAFFVDDPFILDELGSRYMEVVATRRFLLRKLESSRFDENENENVVSTVWTKEKLKEIFDILYTIVPGGIDNSNGEWAFTSDKYSEPLSIHNLSAGLKSFAVLKELLEKGILKEKDILILDEPEIHLHPEWQIKYAEIIVLLQKKFDLSILVTTHSRDFFEAIELFTKKYEMRDKCHFYLSKQERGEVEFEDVVQDSSQIYRHLVEPSRLLDKLKFELEEKDNE